VRCCNLLCSSTLV